MGHFLDYDPWPHTIPITVCTFTHKLFRWIHVTWFCLLVILSSIRISLTSLICVHISCLSAHCHILGLLICVHINVCVHINWSPVVTPPPPNQSTKLSRRRFGTHCKLPSVPSEVCQDLHHFIHDFCPCFGTIYLNLSINIFSINS